MLTSNLIDLFEPDEDHFKESSEQNDYNPGTNSNGSPRELRNKPLEELQFELNKSFIIWMNIVQNKIIQTKRLKENLGFEDNTLSIDAYKKLINPDHRARTFAFGKAMRKSIRHNYKFQSYIGRIAYEIIFPIMTINKEYVWVRQVSLPYEVDRNDLVVSEINIYFILNKGLSYKPEFWGAQLKNLKPNDALNRFTDLESILYQEASLFYIKLWKKLKFPSKFTPRELQVAKLLLELKDPSSKNISHALEISNHTVEKHRKNIILKGKMISIELDKAVKIANYLQEIGRI